jgi:PAS domain S-box-containing protein
LQQKISHTVFDFAAKAAASRAISSCTFSVTIADPLQADIPLVAASPAFELMTGFSCEEIVGKNCRFLNYDCEMDMEEQMRIRECCRTGAHYTCMLMNRRKSGELFMNLLDLRGLRVAVDTETNEEIWYLIGIQSDVTELVEDGDATAAIKESHEEELKDIAEHLRKELLKEFAQLAIASRMEPIDNHKDQNHKGFESETSTVSSVEDQISSENESSLTSDASPRPVWKNARAAAHGSLSKSCSFAAVPGVQEGPKPSKLPNVSLLPEPLWC